MHPAEWLRRALSPLFARIQALASLGVVELSDDDRRAQELQVSILAGETFDPVPRFGEFGFVSRPPKGAEVVVVCLGGDRSNPIVVASEYRDARPTGLAEGEAGLYSINVGTGGVVARLTLRQDGTLAITAKRVTISAETDVAIDSPLVTISGELQVEGAISSGANVSADGNVSAAGDVSDANGSLAEIRTVYNGHTHHHGGSSGETNAPTQPMT